MIIINTKLAEYVAFIKQAVYACVEAWWRLIQSMAWLFSQLISLAESVDL